MGERVVMLGLPYAGGSAYHYQPLQRWLPEWIEFQAVDLPGHGQRIAEPLLESLHEMAADVRARNREVLAGPHVLLGHSMGATVAYLIARAACARGENPPLLLIASGREGPSVPETKRRSHLPRPELVEELRRLGGISSEALQQADLLDLFEPIVRADFAAVESYRPAPAPPLPVPVLVLAGEEDDVTPESLAAWEDAVAAPVRQHCFPGGHFFIFERAREVAACVSEAVAARLAATGWGERQANPDARRRTERIGGKPSCHE